MKKLTLIAVIFIVVALLAIPLTTHAAGSQQLIRTFVPTADAAQLGGDDNGFETTPGNAYADGGGSAVDTNSGVKDNAIATGTGTDKHNYYDYHMDTIPSTSGTIDGITVRADIAVDKTDNGPYTAIRLSWDGGTSWTDPVKSHTLSNTAETTYTYGGSADTWGRTWSGSELTDTNFRVQVINGDTKAANSLRDFSLDYIQVTVTFTPVWDSYSDTARSSQTDTFSGTTNVVYMKGTGFLDGTQTYNVSYYDGGGAKVTTDAGIALVGISGGRGTLGNTGSPYEPTYTLTTDPTAAAGTWHAVAQPSGGTAFPSTYAALTTAPNTYELIADDTFTAEASAIPEFPAVIAAIVVAGLCFGIYFWMRKRRLAYVKA